MTQEEKARRYDEALEKARIFKEHLIEINQKGFADEMEYIFPELKESEDEKIRKEIIDFLWKEKIFLQEAHLSVENSPKYRFVMDAIAWLEKQGDNTYFWKPTKEQINALEHFVRSIGESGYASPYDENIKLLKSLINDLYKLEKQGEQKHCSQMEKCINCQFNFTGYCNGTCILGGKKIEPKFKVGDTMRTLQEANDGYTDGMPVVVSIDNEYYHCNNELIAIKDQDNYEFPPINVKQKHNDKPKWSEEDDGMVAGIKIHLKQCLNNYAYTRYSRWLESLEQRMEE